MVDSFNRPIRMVYCNIELDDNRVNLGKVINNTDRWSAIIKYHSGYFIDSLNILMEYLR
ncbi:hypothetical protein HYD73_03120 [Mycoplasmopsis bovis]|nr:hypothetical protein HYD73_03120 [Mycoplasmopsis bovis]